MNSNDGTTAVQVSPIPTESEMTRIRQIFEYAANAIVRASELGKQVTELEGKFTTLERDYTSVMARNDELVQSLQEVRLQRDEAQSKLVEVRSSFDKAQQDIANGRSESEHYRTNLDKTLQELEAVKADRDGAYKAWHEAEARADEAVAMLAQIKKTLGIVDPPKVAPQAEPIPQATPTVIHDPEPRPMTEAEQAEAKAGVEAIQKAESDVDFNRPYHWDTTLNRWVND